MVKVISLDEKRQKINTEGLDKLLKEIKDTPRCLIVKVNSDTKEEKLSFEAYSYGLSELQILWILNTLENKLLNNEFI